MTSAIVPLIGAFILGFVVGRLTATRRRERVVWTEAAAPPPPVSPADPATVDPEVLADLAAGRLLEAIRRYRQTYGVDLKTAREAVERIAARSRERPAEQ